MHNRNRGWPAGEPFLEGGYSACQSRIQARDLRVAVSTREREGGGLFPCFIARKNTEHQPTNTTGLPILREIGAEEPRNGERVIGKIPREAKRAREVMIHGDVASISK